MGTFFSDFCNFCVKFTRNFTASLNAQPDTTTRVPMVPLTFCSVVPTTCPLSPQRQLSERGPLSSSREHSWARPTAAVAGTQCVSTDGCCSSAMNSLASGRNQMKGLITRLSSSTGISQPCRPLPGTSSIHFWSN